jgi:hypothetical protein
MRAFAAAAFALALLALAFSGAAAARPPLEKNAPIVDKLFAAAVGDRIRKACPSISARMLVVYREARALERRALDEGYSEAEIEAFVSNDAAKKRLEARADAYLAERGATPGGQEAYCRVGRAEIAAKSPIGELLRSR